MKSPSLTLLVLKTHQLNKVREFYELLGLNFTEEKHGQGPVHFSGPAGEALLEIYPLGSNQTPDTTTRLGFAVGDVGKVLGSLVENGTVIISQLKNSLWGMRAVVQDPDGRAVEISQQRRIRVKSVH